MEKKNKNAQDCINLYWYVTYSLNNSNLYINSLKKKFGFIVRHTAMLKILKRIQMNPKSIKLLGIRNNILKILLYIPAYVYSFYFEYKYMNRNIQVNSK